MPVALPVHDEVSCCVVMASPGYPGPYETGLPIEGMEKVDREAVVFHAGTRREGDRWVTAGGRVLGVTGFGGDLTTARAHAYANVKRISFPGAHYRRDIGR
jgi:phosphoribosylamine--glycine ligase